MPSSTDPFTQLSQDQDLQLAIALSKSLMVMPEDDSAVEANLGALSKPSEMMESEEEQERRAAEQLQAFLADVQRILNSAEASGADLHALVPALSEFVASCCSCALSLEQRAFITELVDKTAEVTMERNAKTLSKNHM